MAKITIAGDALVVTSSKTLDEIKLLEKYRPKALRLYEVDEDGNKSEAFRVATTNSNGMINQNGALFNGATHDNQQLACITMGIPAGVEDVVAFAAEQIGVAITMLNKVEAQFDDAIAAVEEEEAAVRKCITVVG